MPVLTVREEIILSSLLILGGRAPASPLRKKVVELSNKEIVYGTLLALPGILAALALGPWLLRLLYSVEFTAAFDIFRWQALGTYTLDLLWHGLTPADRVLIEHNVQRWGVYEGMGGPLFEVPSFFAAVNKEDMPYLPLGEVLGDRVEQGAGDGHLAGASRDRAAPGRGHRAGAGLDQRTAAGGHPHHSGAV